MDLGAESPAAVTELLREGEYIATDEISTAVLLASSLGKPLMLEGQPGAGKTELAKALATATGTDLIRLQCYRGLQAENALYEWDYMKQFLKIRIEAELGEDANPETVEDSIFDEEYLLDRPILEALEKGDDAVLLIDEIDRAGEDFEAFLLEVLDEFQVSIPELGTVSADSRPFVVITSNRSRKLSDALKRRCLYLNLEAPEFDRELEIVRTRAPELSDSLSADVVEFMQRLRDDPGLLREPGVAETIDWARALARLGEPDLDPSVVKQTLSAVLKEPQDVDQLTDGRIQDILDDLEAEA